MDYSLSRLITSLGEEHSGPHRALEDALATQKVFLALLRKAAQLDPGLLAHISSLATRSRWAIAPLLVGLEGASTSSLLVQRGEGGISSTGLGGLDLEGITARLARPEKRRTDSSIGGLDEEAMVSLLGSRGPFAQAFNGFEYRKEQVEMLAAVARAIHQSQHLVVEGGTGVGKSMAYLIPAVLFAVAHGRRVVISTNTINLQEQLLQKDIPAVVKVLEDAGIVAQGVVKAALLKGRANYLCLRRWSYLARSESPSVDEARLLSKTAVWLQDTVSGDRGEINLSGKDAFTWNRVSAGEKGRCIALHGDSPCFVRSARERAEQAHIVVVNHALLLSDLVYGGSVIPDYQHLVIDEAHNLEEEATRQLGFQIAADRLNEELEQQGRLTTQLGMALRAEALTSAVRQQGERAIAEAEALAPRLRESWGRLWAAVEQFLNVQHREGDNQLQVLLTRSVRAQPSWSDLELAWENVDVGLEDDVQRLARLQRFLENTPLPQVRDLNTLIMELSDIQDNLRQLQGQLKAVLGTLSEGRIDWMERNGQKGDITLHNAPLEVGSTLAEQLFAKKECVVLTSATLSTQGTFGYFRERVGVPEDSAELLVGSPFDYRKAALLLIPEDMPEPQARGYLESLSRVLIDLGHALDGRTMALFTSHAALRGASQQVRAQLQVEGIQVLAQGVDGSAQQLMRRFAENPKSVLLGTSSFWEGVDLPGGMLKALVLTRLPFQVPTDPIVMARSAQYSDSFNEYSIPQAVLRFRQGIGRLIRNKGDKGTIVLLDRRITGRSYGQAFLQSMPPCSLKPSSLATVGTLAAQWIGR
jgi:DNA polymerase-3 subunit epsilon/ATP-dependent DNA helicase DinG